MRERLIGLIQDSVDGCARHWAEVIAHHLINNGVILPPCRVGENVYIIEDGVVMRYYILEVAKHNNGRMYFKCVPYRKDGTVDWFNFCTNFADESIGKTVFLSRDEAERALKGGAE